MQIRHALATLLVALSIPFAASAQDAPSPLARALAARYPEHEIVPQSCAAGSERVVFGARICLMDEATGLVRAVRRVSLGGFTSGALRGRDVFFAIFDEGGASTRFAGRVWRWDLGRDAYLGLGNVPQDEPGDARETAFGVLYRIRSGWFLHDGSSASARRVHVPEGFAQGFGVQLWVSGAVTFMVANGDSGAIVRRVELEGDHVRLRDHASVPGTPIHLARGTVITASTRGRVATVRALLLPSTEVIELAMPGGLRAPTGASPIDATHWRLTGPRRQRAVLDLAARTITAGGEDASSAAPASLLEASSLVHVQPSASNGLYVGRFEGGWTLDASGATRVRRRHPREPRARCTCEDAALSCEGGAVRVADACTEVQELDRITDQYAATATGARTRESLYTNDGRFRIDRLEADHVRVTRLRDGARLWVRMFGDALFAQLDDGAFFVSERALVDRMAIRDGRSLLDAPVAPLAPRAGALFRERLIAEFFAPLAP